MSITKISFLKQIELRDRLASVTEADWFPLALNFVKGEMMGRTGITTEQIAGAQIFERVLMDIAKPEPDDTAPIPGPGMDHNLDKLTYENPTRP